MNRYFELRAGGREEFFEVKVAGKKLTYKTGAIGAPGKKTVVVSSSEAEALKSAETMIAERARDGFAEFFRSGERQVIGTSLADTFAAAGIVSAATAAKSKQAAQAEEAGAIDAALLADQTIAGITTRFLRAARERETFAQAIDRANEWANALVAAGHWPKFVEKFAADADEPRAIRTMALPISDKDLSRLEADLGLALPPSYAKFLTSVGAVAFMNKWWDETTAPDKIAQTSREYAAAERDSLVTFLRDDWQIDVTSPRVIRVCDYHNHDAEHFIACDVRDKAGESPVYLKFHDEGEVGYGGEDTFATWFSAKVDETLECAMRWAMRIASR